MITIVDAPGWIFDVQEVSAGMYEVVGSDLHGHKVRAQGIDVDQVISEGVLAAQHYLSPPPYKK